MRTNDEIIIKLIPEKSSIGSVSSFELTCNKLNYLAHTTAEIKEIDKEGKTVPVRRRTILSNSEDAK